MRSALKKPGSGAASRIQQLASGLSSGREQRAHKITKHQNVKRFGHPVSSAPAGPVIKAEVFRRNPPAPAETPKTQAVALPSMTASASHQKLERMLDAALIQADAHKQAMRYDAARHFWQKPRFLGRHKGLKLSVAGLLLLGLVLGAAWQKFPQLSIRLASFRAHVGASVPAYSPEGYIVASPATVQSGAVVLKYKDQDSASSFEVSQQNSNMTSSSLAQTVVPKGAKVQTSHVDGNTVYIYGDKNDAAWVNNGKLYTIKDRSGLSSDQIIKIVQGLN